METPDRHGNKGGLAKHNENIKQSPHTHPHTQKYPNTQTHTGAEIPLGLFASVANFKVVNIKSKPSATCRRTDLNLPHEIWMR